MQERFQEYTNVMRPISTISPLFPGQLKDIEPVDFPPLVGKVLAREDLTPGTRWNCNELHAYLRGTMFRSPRLHRLPGWLQSKKTVAFAACTTRRRCACSSFLCRPDLPRAALPPAASMRLTTHLLDFLDCVLQRAPLAARGSWQPWRSRTCELEPLALLRCSETVLSPCAACVSRLAEMDALLRSPATDDAVGGSRNGA